MARRSSLLLVTPPAVEPLDLATVKSWIKQDGSDDDALITTLIQAAREAAEKFLRRALITQTWRLTLDLEQCSYGNDLPGGVYELPISALYGGLPNIIELPMPPLQSVTSVTTYDTSNAGTVYDPGNYFVDISGERLVLNDNAIWPGVLRWKATCEVVFVVGYGTDVTKIPQAIKSGMLMHIQKMYDGRLVCDLPGSSEQLYRSYRVYGER